MSLIKLTRGALYFGVVLCLFCAIWTTGNSLKWVISAAYLIVVTKYFGLTRKDDPVKGTWLYSPYKELHFYNLRKK